MATLITNIPVRTFQPGVYPFGPGTVTGSVHVIVVEWDATRMTNSSLSVRFVLETSIDNGATWQAGGAIFAQGGQIDKNTGLPLVTGWARFGWDPALTNPRVRGTLTVAGAALKTSGTISWE